MKVGKLNKIIIVLLYNLVTCNILVGKCNTREITVCINENSAGIRSFVYIIDVTLGIKIHLCCHFCNHKENYQPKLWYYRPRVNKSFREVIYGESENIQITPFHTLIINSFTYNNTGIYRCESLESINRINFTYVVDDVFNIKIRPKTGTISQWKDYKLVYLDPLNDKFKRSLGKQFSILRKYNISVKVFTVWDNWGHCNVNNQLKCIRKKMGRCRLSASITYNNNIKGISNDYTFNKIFQYFNDSYDHACRSRGLNTVIPDISRLVRKIPDYEAMEACTLSRNAGKNVKKKENYKYRAIKLVAENSHVTLVCSNNSLTSDISWFRNKQILDSYFKNNLGESEQEPHLTIDIYNNLHILHVSKTEEGNYTCTVNGKNEKQFEVKVVSKTKTLNQEFIRYSIYLTFVLSLTIICYCGGVCVAWHRKASFADPLNLNKIKINDSRYNYERKKLLE